MLRGYEHTVDQKIMDKIENQNPELYNIIVNNASTSQVEIGLPFEEEKPMPNPSIYKTMDASRAKS